MKLSEAFAVLGVSSTADLKEIKAAYRKRVTETHPDKGGNSLEFIKVRAAYEIVCSFLESSDIDDDLPIPDDLRSVIDEIVREFRSQLEKSEAMCANAFCQFKNKVHMHIASASRGELKRFSQIFRVRWNKLILSLFEHFNANCRATFHSYEGWFEKTMEQAFEEIYKRELRSFASSSRFHVYGMILLVFGSLLALIMYVCGASNSTRTLILLGAFPLAMLPFVYWIDCRARRKRPADVQTLRVELFTIVPGAEFQGSAILKQSSADAVTAGFAGFTVGDLISDGDALPILGAVVGYALWEVIGRISNPTEKMRQMILEEFDRFISISEPKLTEYVLDRHRKLMKDIHGEILANYQKGVKRTVLLFASGSSTGQAPFEGSHRRVSPGLFNVKLVEACAAGNVNKVSQLLEKGGDPNLRESRWGYTLLQRAARRGDIDTVKLLLQKGARVDKQAINLAKNCGHKELRHLLTDHLKR